MIEEQEIDQEYESLLKTYQDFLDRGMCFREKETREFKNNLKDRYSFIEGMGGDKQLGIYVFCLLNNISEPPRCENCGSEPVKSVRKDRFTKFCSKKCESEVTIKLMRASTLEKYGVEYPSQSKEVMSRIKKTNLSKYGTEYSLQNPEIRAKAADTHEKKYGVRYSLERKEIRDVAKSNSLKKYGVEYPIQSEEVKEQIKNKNMLTYGVDHYSKTEEYKERVKNTINERYGVDNVMVLEEFKNKHRSTLLKNYGCSEASRIHLGKETISIISDQDKFLKYAENFEYMDEIADSLGVSHTLVNRRLLSVGRSNEFFRKNSSKGEDEIADFIKKLTPAEVMERNTKVGGVNVDIYLPNKKIAIEYNGLYWHCTKFRNKHHHKEKTDAMREMGVRLFHIWEDDWKEKTAIIKRMISHNLGFQEKRIFARKCLLKKVSPSEARMFLEETHIQGKTSASVWLGLEYEGELVAVLGMKSLNSGWDLVRYSTRYNVIGGFTKLLKSFCKNNEWSAITTFANLDYSYGGLYESCGFSLVGEVQPIMSYTNGTIRIHRQNLMKRKLKNKLKDFDDSLSERENLERNRIYQIFNSGLLKYEIKNPLG